MSEEILKNSHEILFRIEDARPEDALDIRTIVREAWVRLYPNNEYGITAEDISSIDWYNDEDMEKRRKMLAEMNENTHVWVIRNTEDKVVGFCKASKFGGKGEIDAMYVLPEVEGKGLGRKLMEKAFNWLGENIDVRLKVVKYNHHAIEFYKKFGFKETGRDVSYEGIMIPGGKEIPRIEMLRLRVV